MRQYSRWEATCNTRACNAADGCIHGWPLCCFLLPRRYRCEHTAGRHRLPALFAVWRRTDNLPLLQRTAVLSRDKRLSCLLAVYSLSNWRLRRRIRPLGAVPAVSAAGGDVDRAPCNPPGTVIPAKRRDNHHYVRSTMTDMRTCTGDIIVAVGGWRQRQQQLLQPAV